jgi:hypothetical protein
MIASHKRQSALDGIVRIGIARPELMAFPLMNSAFIYPIQSNFQVGRYWAKWLQTLQGSRLWRLHVS